MLLLHFLRIKLSEPSGSLFICGHGHILPQGVLIFKATALGQQLNQVFAEHLLSLDNIQHKILGKARCDIPVILNHLLHIPMVIPAGMKGQSHMSYFLLVIQ